jgi:ABC-type multidrug transport system fused ATPase/permease subunit
MKAGHLVESGTFEELMEKKGYFYSLFTVSQ